MLRTLPAVALCLALLVPTASRASASFANNELGLGVSGFGVVAANDTYVNWGVPLTLEGGRYLESGFAMYLRVPFMLLKQTNGDLVFGTGGHFGVRYLFLEEAIRPYVMLHLAGLYLFRPEAPNFFTGPGAGLGVDFFVADSVSIGLRATADLYLTVNKTAVEATVSLGGGASVNVYF